MLSRRTVLAVIAWSIFGVFGERPHAAAQTTADLEAYFVGHWQIDPRQEDDLAVIDGEVWGRVNRDGQGPPIAPTDEELAAYREERLQPMSRSSARRAEQEHDVFQPGGRLLRLRRVDSEHHDGTVNYGTYHVERDESGQLVLVLQMDGRQATRQPLYTDSIQDAFRQERDDWNTGSQYRLLDDDHFQHAVVRDKFPQVYHVRTYARVAAPPDWAAAVLAREAQADPPIVFRLDQGALTVNDAKLPFPCLSAELFEALGEPDRERKTEFNTIYLWDEEGICAYEKPGDFFVYAITLFFDTASLDKRIWPEQPFSGELIINDQPVDGRMTLEEVNQDRATPFQPLPDFAKWKRIQYGNVLITLESTSAELQDDGQHFSRLNLEYHEQP